MVQGRTFALTGLAALVALTLACTGDPAVPLSPSAGGGPGGTNAAADGSTLKASAPAPVSPINGQKPEFGLELKITNSTTTFAKNVPLTYRFEIYDGSTKVYTSGLVPAGSSTTSDIPSANLTVDKAYQWQARAEYQGAVGPWSTPRASFIASTTSGYIRGNEVYDPLIDGKTVGTIYGPVTFIPGVGAHFDSAQTYIEYNLAPAVSSGEFSAMITNLAVISKNEDPKYRVLSMREGSSAINDNRFRFTLDKRGNGAPAYRFITGNANAGQYIESGPGDRTPLNFQSQIWYFWRGTWGGGTFRFTIVEDSPTGKLFYDLSRPYTREYTPNPHNAYLGSPFVGGDRGEPSSAKDMIIKQVWLSSNPRPGFANR